MPETQKNHAENLISLIAEMVAVQKEILTALIEKQEAIRHADPDMLMRTTRKEQQAASRMINLEQMRLHIVSALAEDASLDQVPQTLPEVAILLNDEDCEKLLALSDKLKNLLLVTKRQTDVLTDAGKRLAGYLQHIRNLIQGAISSMNTYSKSGEPHITSELSSSLDLTM